MSAPGHRGEQATVSSVFGSIQAGAKYEYEEGWSTMGAKSDQVKGHAKEAAGSLTGDKDLESEGKADRRAGEAKEKVDHAKDNVNDVIDKAKDASQRK